MKKLLVIILGLVFFVPGLALGVSENGQGSTNGNTNSSATDSSVQTSTSGSTNGTTVQTQTQANNPGTGTMTETQTRTEEQIHQDISEATSQYAPKNLKGAEQRSLVANAVQELIRVAAQINNSGIGDQVRTIAQTQTRNQDKIGQSIDKVETRTGFAKFFIGANYKELKVAKDALLDNQNQIKELNQLLTQLTDDADKVAIASQIITLQQTQLEIKDQLTTLSGGFSLFGWINRWFNKY